MMMMMMKYDDWCSIPFLHHLSVYPASLKAKPSEQSSSITITNITVQSYLGTTSFKYPFDFLLTIPIVQQSRCWLMIIVVHQRFRSMNG